MQEERKELRPLKGVLTTCGGMQWTSSLEFQTYKQNAVLIGVPQYIENDLDMCVLVLQNGN